MTAFWGTAKAPTASARMIAAYFIVIVAVAWYKMRRRVDFGMSYEYS